MEIEDLTIGQAREISQLLEKTNIKTKVDNPYPVGKNVCIRTVTMLLLGKLESVGGQELVLTKASWVADTGRYHDFITKGVWSSSSEVEPYLPDQKVIVGRGSIIDATEWLFELPEKQK